MRVLILGCDGYLGWTTTLYFSARGHEVVGIDNYLKRRICKEIGEYSLTSIKTVEARAEYWNEKKNKDVQILIGDITDYKFLKEVFRIVQPDVVVDYAEIASAPYSMIDRDKAATTLINNTIGTLNIAHAVKEECPKCTILKYATMGEASTPNTDIPEGFFEFEYNGRKDTRLFPREGGSLYHTSKVSDTDILWFYTRVWKLAVHNICQGPVVGLLTDEMENDPNLYTAFHFGEVHGTVINRFIAQALIDYPLTIYGKGGQTRGYLNIKDTIECTGLLAANPPKPGEMKIINQITQTFTINELAEKVQRVGRKLGYNTTIQSVPNPRIEKEEHYYNPKYTTLLDLGLKPNYLTDEVIEEMFKALEPYKDEIDKSVIFKGYKWK